MRLYRRPDRGGVRINIASLIDVVFLLIIFFMTVSHIVPNEMDLELPEAESGAISKESDFKRVVFNVDSGGVVYVLGQEIDIAGAGQMLSEEIAIRGADMIEVVIRGDRVTDWGNVATIMSKCRGQGIRRVKVGVVEK